VTRVAIIAIFDIPGATQAQYEAACDKLTRGRGLVRTRTDWPILGLISHVAGPTPHGWLVVDVWDSDEAFQKFAEILRPILQEIGMPDAKVRVTPAFNAVTA
jgi:hypothetical protein